MTDIDPRARAQDLLKELEICPVIFDPTFDHQLGAALPPKVTILSAALRRRLHGFLSSLTER
jgi:hypothetical protein